MHIRSLSKFLLLSMLVTLVACGRESQNLGGRNPVCTMEARTALAVFVQTSSNAEATQLAQKLQVTAVLPNNESSRIAMEPEPGANHVWGSGLFGFVGFVKVKLSHPELGVVVTPQFEIKQGECHPIPMRAGFVLVDGSLKLISVSP